MSAASEYSSTDICLAFKDVSICTLVPPKPILSNVSGFVAKGSITAVFGASASGKSLLLQALSARVQSLAITGSVFMNGQRIDPTSNENSISYVSQDTMLIGDLTAKEMVTNSARLKTKMPTSCVEESVDAVLKDFGLDHVADTYIGTIFRAGLSGGQKRRVDVAVELVSAPSLLLLDEPTSGLDGSIAYDVLSTIRNAVKSRPRANALSVMLNIHQPNSRILGLFDHILVLGDHGMVFFGTVAESVQHFTQIGYAPPPKYTPTDYYLNITDTNFAKNNKFDFVGAFNSSQKWMDLIELVDLVESRGQIEQLIQMMNTSGADRDKKIKSARAVGNTEACTDLEATCGDKAPASRADTECMLARNKGAVGSSFWNQVYILVKRDYILAARDPTMYVLQVVLVLVFGVMVGAVFFDLKYRIDESMTYIPGALLWVIMVMIYIQVFKVYHLNKANQRFAHEHTNGSYSVLAGWCADLISVSTLLVSYIPGAAIAFFMAGFPGKAFPFLMLLFWMSALASESMLGFITKFFKDISASVVASQLVLVLLTAFGAGLFIKWQDTPAYWEWLQVLSMFTHASRAAMLSVMRKLTYECRLAGDGNCYGPSGDLYECVAGSVLNNKCDVTGTTVLYVTQGVPKDESYWESFGYLVALFAAFRLASLVLMYFPFDRIVFALQKQYHSPDVLMEVISSHLKIKQLEQRVMRLMGYRHAYEALAQADGTVETIPPAPQRSASKRTPAAAPGANPEASLADGPSADGTLRLSWTNLDLVLKKGGKKLIDNVSGSVQAGKVLALMGPSGAGKTTLLNALANRAPYGNVTGAVRFGGLPLTSKDLMYVPQFDEIKGYTTVVEQIELVGLMKCQDQRAMRKRLVQLLQILGLFEKANVLCKDLSGGELKRLSVGMGMIANPKVLFLDEPTTGLDSTAAFYLVQFLVDLARDLNVPVIMTIHQPAVIVFDMLPELYLLEGGRLAFFGPVPAAQRYFSDMGFSCPSEVNPADFYLNLIYKAPVAAKFDTWREIYYDSALGQQMVRQLEQEQRAEERLGVQAQVYDEPSYASRFYYLTVFFLRYYWVNPGYYVFRAVYLILCAVYIGTLYLNLETNTSELVKYSGSIFFSIWATLFAAVGSTGLIASDRRQSFEQIKNGIITPSISCASMFLASLPYNLVCAFAFQLIFHWVSGINPSGESFMYGVILTMGHMTMMEAIMNIVVEVVKDAMLSVTMAMLVMGMLFLFPGFFIQVSAMPEWISWISYIIPTKYTFDGYLNMIFISQDFDVQTTGMVISGKDILIQLFDNKNVNAWGMIGVLIAYIALFRLVHYALFLYASLPFLSKNEDSGAIKKTGNQEPQMKKDMYQSVAQHGGSGEVELV